MKPRSYEESGVSIDRGDAFASYLARLKSPAVGAIGGFAGGVELDASRFRQPMLLSTTDGVGTKLLVAKRLGDYSTVGIDLVAMCVNDLAVCGAEPVSFLDYIACGTIREALLEQVMEGIVAGCEAAGCILSGGETAELPDMYAADEIDMAGFAVGLVEKEERLPRLDQVVPGDHLVGLASSGVHSNGFSLARRVVDNDDEEMLRELLRPTRVYVDALRKTYPFIKGAAHITGGGIDGNIARIVPEHLSCDVTWRWQPPAVFASIQNAGDIPDSEMRRVFNMGVGIAMVVAPEQVDSLQKAVGEPLIHLGSVVGG